MPKYLCRTCGVQIEEAREPPDSCQICTDDRQYVGRDGQQWTTLEKLRQSGFKNRIEAVDDELYKIITDPSFGIGQRAFLVRTRSGNLLWDCISYLDDETVTSVKKLGGIDAIAISHPHYYSSMIEWSEAFGGAPVYVHSLDRKWVQRKSPKITFWKGEKTSPLGGLEIVNLGGHFDGSSVLYLREGAHGTGVLLSGDTISCCHGPSLDNLHVQLPKRDSTSSPRGEENCIANQTVQVRKSVRRV